MKFVRMIGVVEFLFLAWHYGVAFCDVVRKTTFDLHYGVAVCDVVKETTFDCNYGV